MCILTKEVCGAKPPELQVLGVLEEEEPGCPGTGDEAPLREEKSHLKHQQERQLASTLQDPPLQEQPPPSPAGESSPDTHVGEADRAEGSIIGLGVHLLHQGSDHKLPIQPCQRKTAPGSCNLPSEGWLWASPQRLSGLWLIIISAKMRRLLEQARA